MKVGYLVKGLPGHPLHPPLTDLTIGTYTFVVTEDGASRHVVADAKYRVRLLVVDAFSYEHHDEETWHGDCLVQLATRTVERRASARR